jgi:ABC-type uncharacterized transport system involved in gliding motility auxiliary subunit
MLQQIASIVGWIGTALVFGAVGVRLFRPEWNQYATWAAWAGLVCVLLYMAAQWRSIFGAFGRRQTRLGTIAASTVFVVLGILVAVNYLAARRNVRWDLTANQQFSLSEQTKQILEKLDAPLRVKVFDRPTEFDRFRERLGEYAYVSDNVSVEYIDVDREPAVARQYEIATYGTVVLEYEGRVERVTAPDEQQIANGLIKLITGEERRAYFIQGHGEKDPNGSARDSYNRIAADLRSENFTVETLVLAQQGSVPGDATVVILAGPTTDLLPGEIDALRAYLNRGGKLLALIDPPEKGAQPLANLSAFLQEWAIELGDNVVVDASGMGQLLGTDASVPVAARYPSHPIVEGFRLLTAYPLARSVQPVTGVEGRTAQPFVESSPQSWGETNTSALFESGQVENNPGQDLQGPVTLAAAISVDAPEPPARLRQRVPRKAPLPTAVTGRTAPRRATTTRRPRPRRRRHGWR